MSLLEIVQGALREAGEFDVPTTVIGNANRTATQALALADRGGRLLARRHGWSALAKVKTFTSNGSEQQAAGTIPSDFRYIINATAWDDTENWRLRGPATPVQWETLKRGIVTQSVRQWFRIYGDNFYLWPGTTTVTIAFEYMSDQWVDTDADGVGEATSWQADDDTSLLDEEILRMDLVWRWKNAKGLPYAEEFNETEREIRKAMGWDKGKPQLFLSAREVPYLLGPDSIPDTGFGAD